MSGAARYCRRCGYYLPGRQQKCLACGAWDYPGIIREANEPVPYTVAILYADDAPVMYITGPSGDIWQGEGEANVHTQCDQDLYP